MTESPTLSDIKAVTVTVEGEISRLPFDLFRRVYGHNNDYPLRCEEWSVFPLEKTESRYKKEVEAWEKGEQIIEAFENDFKFNGADTVLTLPDHVKDPSILAVAIARAFRGHKVQTSTGFQCHFDI